MRRLIAPVLAVLLVAGCGDDLEAGLATTTLGTITAPSTTAASTTTPVAPATTTTVLPPSTTSSTMPATTTTTVAATTTSVPDVYPPDPFAESVDGAAGSGCVPGAQVLPDGHWFGFLSEVAGQTVTFDLACFYFGDVAWEKAAEQGEEAYNDYWIVNENPRLRSIEVEEGATAWWIAPDVSELQPLVFGESWPVDPAEVAYTDCPGEWCTVWLVVVSGIATEIVEQYLP